MWLHAIALPLAACGVEEEVPWARRWGDPCHYDADGYNHERDAWVDLWICCLPVDGGTGWWWWPDDNPRLCDFLDEEGCLHHEREGCELEI